eukprot:TRINITY_DN818_c0_g1_i1.p1 TRINITY_DN818_c0_g1~~TRINITY_DN818_c0_g1_i1.p1  ORF type:complete len:535 (+),score=120.80 TRINITY_DN818_c0_g1_i1:194-1798(+)
MKEVKVGSASVLLVKDRGTVRAIGNQCSHFGAPLIKGAYSNGKVRCPWHGACFSTATGDIEEFPGCYSIPSYPVTVRGSDVVLHGTNFNAKKRPFPPCKSGDRRTFIILGAGGAGVTAAFELRKEGFGGRVILVGAEEHLPYDRTKLSKGSYDPEKIQLLALEEYQNQRIELKLGVQVVSLNADTKAVELSDVKSNNKEVLIYDACLIATGSKPQRLEQWIKGNNTPHENVLVLRTISDARDVIQTCKGEDVVIIGSSFIGMETAACILKEANSVTVVGMEKVPFERVLGPVVGAFMMNLHESKGVKFIMGAVCDEFECGGDGRVHRVILKDGQVLKCGVVIIGAGVIPVTDYISSTSAVKIEKDKSVLVNQYLSTGADGLYAAGDLARFPLPLLDNALVRIEHWGMAMTLGKVAAKNMLGKQVPVTNIPFFWTHQFGKVLRYCGHGINVDNIVLDKCGKDFKDLENASFLVYYFSKNKLVAAASLNADPVVAEVAQLMNDGITLTANELEEVAKNGTSAAFIHKKLYPTTRNT